MNIHLIAHTHWDREWYFNTEESKSLLIYFMDELLNVLENDSSFKYFVLDGQAVILDDYIDLVPENRGKIKKLVLQGKLIIGPWYTQTDQMVVSGESIVRNLYYGIKTCEEYGPWMKIGYVPDSFGQSQQLPQILNGFGIDNAVFWRGIYEKSSKLSEFIWNSPDGSKVFTVNLPLGYAVGKYLPGNPEDARMRIKGITDKIYRKASSSNVLVPNGHDQMPVQRNLPYIVESLNKSDKNNKYILSNFDEYISAVKKETHKFDNVYGEFLYPKYMRIHRSIYSTRADIKMCNVEIENLIIGYIEPILTIAWDLGFIYPAGAIEKLWKLIFENQAHDSLGCCNTDEVNGDIMARFNKARELADGILAINKRMIAESIKSESDGEKIVIFNTLGKVRNDVFTDIIFTENENFKIVDKNNNIIPYDILDSEDVDMGTIDRRIAADNRSLIYKKCRIAIKPNIIPALGYETYYIIKSDSYRGMVKDDKYHISNEYFDISLDNQGELNLYDKNTGGRYNDVLVIENGSDAGDEYNYSPLLEDFLIRTSFKNAQVECEKGLIIQRLKINLNMYVPKNIEERKNKKVSTSIPVNITITLSSGSRRVGIKITIDNQAEDGRFRALLKTGIQSRYSYADEQFGTIERPNEPEELKIWKKENWSEKPVPIYPMQSFIDINDGRQGLAVLTKTLREYEVIGEKFDTIAITLFRSVGILGKNELVNRPGRASGISIKTPDSQLIKKMDFEFSLYPHSGDTYEGNVANESKLNLVPLCLYQVIDQTKFRINKPAAELKGKFSILQIQSNMILSAVKKAENKDGIIIRMFNPSTEKQLGGEIRFNEDITKACNVNLQEDITDEILVHNNKINLGEFSPCQVKSFLIK